MLEIEMYQNLKKVAKHQLGSEKKVRVSLAV
jgi:hypothetical protein